MVNKEVSSQIMYQNSNSQFIKHTTVFIICIIAIIITIITPPIIWKSTKSFVEEPTGYFLILFCAIIFLVALWFSVKSFRHVVDFRNILIDSEGIHKYWLSSKLAYEFVPFNEIAACYITEEDFETIRKFRRKNIIPIVLDAGIIGSCSKKYPDGNDIIIFTKNYKEISLYNLDDVSSVFTFIKNNMRNEKLEKYILEQENLAKEKSENDNSAKNNSKKDPIFSGHYSYGSFSGCNNFGSNVNTNKTFDTKTEEDNEKDEQIISEFKLSLPLVAYIFLSLIFTFPNMILAYMAPLKALIIVNIIILLLLAFIIYCIRPSKVQITTKGIKVIKNNNEIEYSCSASNFKFCEIVYYVNGTTTKTDGYSIRIEDKNGQNYSLCDIKPKNFNIFIHSISIMILAEANII